ncbi:MAG TPA: Hsp20/alpha crystallin family protein [Acidocella sp.]|nr:MAG: hypothetical protein B7Z81_05965 [Acidocella sp. 20-61-6]HQT47618.1 Hsp20/alpha crystallin family protein [Acidocella sp.]
MASSQVEVKKTEPPAASQPPALWRSFRDEFDQLFDRFSRNLTPWSFPLLGGGAVPTATSFFSAPLPSVDVVEDDKSYTVTAELPGLTAEDVDVSLEGSSLIIKGEKQNETKKEEKNYYLSERSYGAFERSFYLPDGVDRDKIKAEVAKGVLTVTLPKTAAAQAKTKKIEVKST